MATKVWTHGYHSLDGWLLKSGQVAIIFGHMTTKCGQMTIKCGQMTIKYVRMATKCGHVAINVGTDGYLFVDGWLLSISMSAKCDKFPTIYMNICTIIAENSYYNTHTHMSVHILNSNLSTKLGICHISVCCDITVPSSFAPSTNEE